MATSNDSSSHPKSDADVKTFSLDVTSEAVEQIRGLLKDQKPDMAVRVYVQAGGGGGCGSGCGSSAPAFGMAFDRAKSGDNVLMINGVKFVVDPYSADFVNGANVEFVTVGDDSGFKVTNPNLPVSEGGGGCGCGSGGCGSGGEESHGHEGSGGGCGSGGCGCGG